MSDELDALANVIHTTHCLERVHNESCMFWDDDRESANAALAAGYRKPRVVAGSELDGLPVKTIIMDAKGYCWQTHKSLAGQHHWYSATRNDGYYTSMNLVADDRTPATVLWEPQS